MALKSFGLRLFLLTSLLAGCSLQTITINLPNLNVAPLAKRSAQPAPSPLPFLEQAEAPVLPPAPELAPEARWRVKGQVLFRGQPVAGASVVARSVETGEIIPLTPWEAAPAARRVLQAIETDAEGRFVVALPTLPADAAVRLKVSTDELNFTTIFNLRGQSIGGAEVASAIYTPEAGPATLVDIPVLLSEYTTAVTHIFQMPVKLTFFIVPGTSAERRSGTLELARRVFHEMTTVNYNAVSTANCQRYPDPEQVERCELDRLRRAVLIVNFGTQSEFSDLLIGFNSWDRVTPITRAPYWSDNFLEPIIAPSPLPLDLVKSQTVYEDPGTKSIVRGIAHVRLPGGEPGLAFVDDSHLGRLLRLSGDTSEAAGTFAIPGMVDMLVVTQARHASRTLYVGDQIRGLGAYDPLTRKAEHLVTEGLCEAVAADSERVYYGIFSGREEPGEVQWISHGDRAASGVVRVAGAPWLVRGAASMALFEPPVDSQAGATRTALTTLFVGSSDGHVYALEDGGDKVRTFDMGEGAVPRALVFATPTLYAAVYDNAARLVSVDVNTGATEALMELGNGVFEKVLGPGKSVTRTFALDDSVPPSHLFFNQTYQNHLDTPQQSILRIPLPQPGR